MYVRERLLFKSRWLMMFAISAVAVAVAAEGPYHLIKKIPVSGDYGWDYLTADSESRRLYVSHDREVVVLDLDTNAVIGKISGASVHGIAIAKDFGRSGGRAVARRPDEIAVALGQAEQKRRMRR